MRQDDTFWDDRARTQQGLGPGVALGAGTPSPAPLGSQDPRQSRGVAAPTRFRLGTRLDGNGHVYEAQSPSYPTRVAVKLFPFAHDLSPSVVDVFTHEAAKVAELRHPHVVHLLRAGLFSNGTPFLAMELLRGQSLTGQLAARGPLSVSGVLTVVRAVASALVAAHTAGVAHGNVCGQSVFLVDLPGYDPGFVKLLDFGVHRLKVAARDAGRIVSPVESPWTAPEQRQSRDEAATARGDQFSLAALCYRMLTGADPTPGLQDGPGFARLTDGFAGGGTRKPCPPQVQTVLARALSWTPADRYESVEAFFRALHDAMASAGVAPAAAPADLATGRYGPVPDGTGGQRTDDPTVLLRPSAAGVPATAPEGAVTVPQAFEPTMSLTQAFFAAGDAVDEAHAAGAPGEAPDFANDEHDDALDVAAWTADDRRAHVPRRRLPTLVGIAVAAVALAMGGAWVFGVIGHAPGPRVDLHPDVAPATTKPTNEARIEAPSEAPNKTAATAAAAKTSSAAPPSAAAATPTPTTNRPAPTAATNAAASPVTNPTTPQAAPQRPKEPLRGYVWSAKRRRLVRAHVAPLPPGPPPPSPYDAPSPGPELPAP